MPRLPSYPTIRSMALLVPAICLGASAVAADLTPSKTIAQLAQEQGSDPDYRDPTSGRTNMAQDVPRDFPVPAESRDLHYSNFASIVSLSGTPQQAKAFYEEEIFKTQTWTVEDRIEMVWKGKIEYGIVACKLSQCVNVSSNNDDPYSKNTIKLHFFKK